MKRLFKDLLGISIVMALIAVIPLIVWATGPTYYYVDSSATIAGSQTTGTFVSGDWLMQANTNAKCRYMSGTGPITVSAITPGQPTSTANQVPNSSDIWTDISSTYTFTITGPASSITAGALYINNSVTFSVNTTISAGVTTLVTTGEGVPEASGTLTKVAGTGEGCPTTITFSANTTSQGATFTPSGAPVYNGADTGSGTISAPWRTLTYATVNATYGAGNGLLMKCGDTFVDWLGLYGGGTSGGQFTVSSYGSGANPRIYGSIPKFGADWKQTYIFTITSHSASAGATYTSANGQTFTVLVAVASGTTMACSGTGAPDASGTLTYVSGTPTGNITYSAVSADSFYCYLSGYNMTQMTLYLVLGNGSIMYNLDGDSLLLKTTIAALVSAPGFRYDSTNGIMFMNLVGASPAAPGGITNPITSNNIYWISVYNEGLLTNYNGAWPNGHNPAYGYITISNLDFYRNCTGIGLCDATPTYCSSNCIIANVNLWYIYWGGVVNTGTNNAVWNVTAHHSKTLNACGCFAFFGQGTQTPSTDNDYYYNCIYADNASTYGNNYAMGTSTTVAGTQTVTNCGWINCSITGNCIWGVYLDGQHGVMSAITVKSLYISGVTSQAMWATLNGAGGLVIDGINMVTPSTSTSGAIQLYFPTAGNYIVRRCFLNTPNASAFTISSLVSGASFSAYGNIMITGATRAGFGFAPSADSTISLCSNNLLGASTFLSLAVDVDCTLRNNIGYNLGHFLTGITTTNNMHSDFNYCYPAPSAYWAKSVALGTWFASYAQDQHSYSGSNLPGFVNASGTLSVPTDFMLKTTAQALWPYWVCSIGGATGKPTAVSGIDRDYFGTFMPNGGGCQDVGAYQQNRSGAWSGF